MRRWVIAVLLCFLIFSADVALRLGLQRYRSQLEAAGRLREDLLGSWKRPGLPLSSGQELDERLSSAYCYATRIAKPSEFLKAALFKEEALPKPADVAYSIEKPLSSSEGWSRRGHVLYATNHKAGTEVAREILCWQWSDGCEYHAHSEHFWTDKLIFNRDRPTSIDHVSHDASASSDPMFRIIHMVRAPIAMIKSAFEYHLHTAIQSDEPWLFRKASCYLCYPENSCTVFQRCNRNCSYRELLTMVGQEEGSLLEVLRSQRLLENMYANTKRWLNHRNVLHLSVDHMAKDEEMTIQCIANWSGYPSSLKTENLGAEHIAQQKQHRHVALRDAKITRGKFDTTVLDRLLQNPAWTQQFDQINQALSAVYERQSRLFGCPTVYYSLDGV